MTTPDQGPFRLRDQFPFPHVEFEVGVTLTRVSRVDLSSFHRINRKDGG